MSNKRTTADCLDQASKHASAARARELLCAARVLANADGNACSPSGHLGEAYAHRLHRVVETHMEHLRQHEFSAAAQWRTASMTAADEALDDAQSAVLLASV